jgi:hypothetical protein
MSCLYSYFYKSGGGEVAVVFVVEVAGACDFTGNLNII